MSNTDPHQRLLRHEALLDLLMEMLGKNTVAAIANSAADRWKYCATIDCWRLLMEDSDGRFLIVDGQKSVATARVIAAAELNEADAKRYARRIPERLTGARVCAAASSFAEHLRAEAIEDVVVVPIGERRSIGRGLLYAGVANHQFDKLDLKFISVVGSFLAYQLDVCRQQERVVESLREASLRDGLTEIANRKKFDGQFLIEWQRARRNAASISLLLIDVDYFKQFNDRFGHMAGDECLRKVAAAISDAACRAADMPARFGGEEFVLLLPETTLEGAAKVGARVLDAVRALKIPHFTNGEDSIVTVSVGCASAVASANLSSEALLAATDAALYAAKHRGRDQCFVDSATLT